MQLNKLIYQGGIPDEVKGLRPLIWRVLLNYLPDDDTTCWNDTLTSSNAVYEEWKKELITTPQITTQADPKEMKT